MPSSVLGTVFLTVAGALATFMLHNTKGAIVTTNVGAALPSSPSFPPDAVQREVPGFLPTNLTDSLTGVVIEQVAPIHLGTLPRSARSRSRR